MESFSTPIQKFIDSWNKYTWAKPSDIELVMVLARDMEPKLSAIRSHFSKLPDYAFENMVLYYLKAKMFAERNPDYYERKAYERLTQFRADAEKAFWEIQQKKLFNAQCPWRADKVKLKGIKLTVDFNYWEDRIEHCPAIEPVTREEVDLYIRYLSSTNCNAGQFRKYYRYQDYDEWKRDDEAEDKNGNLSAWFEFYDTYMGTGHLLRLPDVRFELEMHYYHYEAERKKTQEPSTPATPPNLFVKNPTYHFIDPENKPIFAQLASKMEEPEIALLFKEWARQIEDKYLRHDKSEMQTMIDLIMSGADRPVPIKAHYNFREAVINAAFDYKHERMAEHMHDVYEDYLFRREMGIVSEMKPPLTPEEAHKYYAKHILNGREAAGEPRNLNF
jgi:hypothetical protein